MDNNELKLIAYRQRVAEIVSEYEEKIADLRVNAHTQIESLQAEVKRLSDYINERNDNVVSEAEEN